jgi:hypothetical protein
VKRTLADSLLIALLAALLVWPLFGIEYFDNWASIDSAFIADIRFLSENLPHPGWNPLWYCGVRFDYTYPPAMRYGSALLARFGGISPARAYHLYSAIFYVLAIAGVYALVRTGSGSRRLAWLAAAASALVSPVFLLMKIWRDDSFLHMPQRLNVIVKWGEVPHMSALAVLPFALAAAWAGVTGKRPAMLGLSAVLCALAVSNNFYGATALAVFFPLLVWSLWITRQDNRVWLRATAVAVLAYGLTAFWLTPSYLRLTVENLKLVAEPGNAWSRWLAAFVAALFLALSWKLTRGRPARAWPLFIFGSLLFFGLNVLGKYYFNFRVVGEPHRFVPELDLLLILAAVECMRYRAWAVRLSGAAILAAALVLSLPYLARPWSVFVADLEPGRRVEYRLTEWIARNLPGARVFATGSLRLWYSAWRDLPQVGGGSEQGLSNPMLPLAQWQITQSDDAERDILWLYALGADAIVVHGPQSREIYHHIGKPEKFIGRLPVLLDDGEGNIIYRVPRRFPGLARVIGRARMEALPEIGWHNYNREQLRAYVETLESGSGAIAEWQTTRAMRIRARTVAGESIAVQVSYDPAWRASSAGKTLPIYEDVMGFLRIDPPPGEHDIRLFFQTPRENRIGRAAAILAALAILGMWLRSLGPLPYRRGSSN